jgi:hypothetical protein
MWLVDDEVVTIWGMLIFIIFISSIWHPWLMTKWRGHPIVIIIIKKWLQVIWYEHRQPYPLTYLCTYLFTYPPTHAPTHLPTYPPMHPTTHPPIGTYPPTHLLHQPTYLPTYLLFPIFYNPLISYLSSYHLLPIS